MIIITTVVFALMAASLTYENVLSSTEKADENAYMKEIRHKQKWMTEAMFYQSVVVVAVWLSLNYAIRVGRDHAEVLKELNQLNKDKDPVLKKNEWLNL